MLSSCSCHPMYLAFIHPFSYSYSRCPVFYFLHSWLPAIRKQDSFHRKALRCTQGACLVLLYCDKESPNMHDVPSRFAYICTYYKEDAPAVSRAVSLTAYAHSPALSNHSVLFPTIIFNVIARLYLSFFMIPQPQYVPHSTGARRSIKS